MEQIQTQKDLRECEIGTDDNKPKLLPKVVKIVAVDTETTPKGGSICKCTIEHPDDSPIIHKISTVKYIEPKTQKIEQSGLWYNMDKDKPTIRKNSALAIFLTHMGCKKASELVGKTCMTEHDENKYLAFKGY